MSGIGDEISGDCSELTLIAACGGESSNTWNSLPVPVFGSATNYYMALWETSGADFDINNFKARFGCGSGELCGLVVDVLGEECIDENTYQVAVEVSGVNAEYIASDVNALNSDTTSCLTLADDNVNTIDTLYLNYTIGVDYNITIAASGTELDAPCPVSINYMDCDTTVSGSSLELPVLVCIDGSVPCFGDMTGTVEVTASGSVPPYSYEWENNSAPGVIIGTTAQITNLGAGLYNVTVTDDNGCIETCTATVSQPPLFSASYMGETIPCGSTSGTVSVSTGGGSAPFSYEWEDSMGGTIGGDNPSVSGLAPGTYFVTVTDKQQLHTNLFSRDYRFSFNSFMFNCNR